MESNASVEIIFTPGATTSGYPIYPNVGPQLLKEARLSLSSVAPTEITSIPEAGVEPVKYSGPELPAEDTKITPKLFFAFVIACVIESEMCGYPPPKLMEIISAPAPPNLVGLELHWIAFTISPSSAAPLEFNALALINCTPGATPRYFPKEPPPSLPTIPATCVPWPITSSSVNSSATKLLLFIIVKSG